MKLDARYTAAAVWFLGCVLQLTCDHATIVRHATPFVLTPRLPNSPLRSMMSYSSLIPHLPVLLESKKLGPARYGQLQSAGNGAALLFSPLLGALSDALGRKPALMGCALGSAGAAVSFGLAGSARYGGLLLRFIDRSGTSGLLKSLALDLTPAGASGASSIGIIMMGGGLGFSAGTSIGGYVGQSRALLLGTAAPLLNVCLMLIMLPGLSKRKSAEPAAGEKEAGWREVLAAMDRNILGLLLVRVITGGAFYLIIATFDL